MALSVYSSNLLEELGLNGSAGFPCPAGKVMVVRDIDCYALAPATSNAHLRFVGNLGETLWLFQVDFGQQASGQWRGRQVFTAAQSFGIQTDSAFDVKVSGYLLNAP